MFLMCYKPTVGAFLTPLPAGIPPPLSSNRSRMLALASGPVRLKTTMARA